jgi:hypothetical protein
MAIPRWAFMPILLVIGPALMPGQRAMACSRRSSSCGDAAAAALPRNLVAWLNVPGINAGPDTAFGDNDRKGPSITPQVLPIAPVTTVRLMRLSAYGEKIP